MISLAPTSKLRAIVAPITIEEALNFHRKSYNPSEWNKAVKRFNQPIYAASEIKEGTAKYYVEKREPVKYSFGEMNNDRLWVVYELKNGLRFIKEIDYSTTLHNGGFIHISISPDGEIFETEFTDGKKTGRLENNKSVREYLSKMCDLYPDWIISND